MNEPKVYVVQFEFYGSWKEIYVVRANLDHNPEEGLVFVVANNPKEAVGKALEIKRLEDPVVNAGSVKAREIFFSHEEDAGRYHLRVIDSQRNVAQP